MANNAILAAAAAAASTSLLCLLQILLLSTAVDRVEAQNGRRLKVLVIAPNFYKAQSASKKVSHFAYKRQMVELLMAQEWVAKVHMLVPQITSEDRDEELEAVSTMKGSKLHLQYFNPGGDSAKAIAHDVDHWTTTTAGVEENEEQPAEHLKHYGTEPDRLLAFAEHKQLVDMLRKEQFDVGIAEVWFYAAFPLLWLANVKHLVGTLNLPISSVFYEYMDPKYLEKIISQGNVPEAWSAEYGVKWHRMNVDNSNRAFDEMDKRFAQIYHEQHYHESEHPKSVVKVPPPKFRDLFRQSRHFFVNTQPFLDFPMPEGMPNKVVYIGGIMMPAVNTSDTQNFDAEENRAIQAATAKKGGLILVSFGTLVNTKNMPKRKFEAMIEAFHDLHDDYEFIWKMDDGPADNSRRLGHVHIKPWLNQMGLLAHPQTKLFISHCGINSTVEAARFGVPLLCIPFVGDQFYNAEAMAQRGVGVVLDKDTMEMNGNFKQKLEEALKPRYAQQMRLMKKDMANIDPAHEFLSKMHEFVREQK